MTNRKFIPALVLAASLGAGGMLSLPPVPAQAQAANPAPAAPARPAQQQQRPMRPSMIEGRIAFLKAELKITPAQETAWDKVAQAMRQNDTERRQLFEQRRSTRSSRGNVDALQALERRARVSAMRAQQTDRFLTAFRPLYDSLSTAQKQTADELLAFRGRHGHFHRRG